MIFWLLNLKNIAELRKVQKRTTKMNGLGYLPNPKVGEPGTLQHKKKRWLKRGKMRIYINYAWDIQSVLRDSPHYSTTQGREIVRK